MDLKFIITSLLFFSVSAARKSQCIQPKCFYDSDCGLNSYCKGNKVCECKTGYVLSNYNCNYTTCLKEAMAISDPCFEEIQCTVAFGTKAECFKDREAVTGSCQCKSGAHFEDNLCYPSISLGGHCQVTADCTAKSNVSTFCHRSKCVCQNDYHPTRDGTDCLKSSNIGDGCENDEYCISSNSQCVDNICRCKSFYISSYDSKRCLPIVDGLGKKCEEDSQCQVYLRHTECDSLSKQCTCSPTAMFKDGYCWSTADLGDICYDSRECVIKSQNNVAVTCSNKICSCAPGFKSDLATNDCIRSSGKSSHGLIQGLPFQFLMLSNLIVCVLIPYQIK